MFSRNRDEAFGMRWRGRLSDAYRLLYVSPELCNRLTHPLLNLFGAVSEHARHFATGPNLAPLDARYFRSIRGQRTALLNEFFGTVLLTRRSQFLHKIHALARLVADLGESFRAAAERLGADGSVRPDRKWGRLDTVHYDLNTCLREAAVLLKSFLHALPAGRLPEFADGLGCRSVPRLPFQLDRAILPIDG